MAIDVDRARDRRLRVALLVAVPVTAVIGLALIGLGARSPAPAGDLGSIAFVHATYEDRALGWTRPSDPCCPTAARQRPWPTCGSVHAAVRCCAPWNPEHDVLAGPAVRWSPGGDRIAFRMFNDEPGIYVMNRDGSGLSRVVQLLDDEFSGLPFSPAIDWSPDGHQIAFTYPYDHVRRSFTASAIHVVDTRDGVVQLPGDGATRTVAWSPDGTMIAFARLQADRTTGLFVVNADGTGERRLDDPASGGNVQVIAWSPDGSQIAVYDSFDRTMNQPVLRVIGADGSEAHVVKAWSNEGCCFVVSVDSLFEWSPDGSRIGMVQTDASGRPGILLVNADGRSDRVRGRVLRLVTRRFPAGRLRRGPVDGDVRRRPCGVVFDLRCQPRRVRAEVAGERRVPGLGTAPERLGENAVAKAAGPARGPMRCLGHGRTRTDRGHRRPDVRRQDRGAVAPRSAGGHRRPPRCRRQPQPGRASWCGSPRLARWTPPPIAHGVEGSRHRAGRRPGQRDRRHRRGPVLRPGPGRGGETTSEPRPASSWPGST